MTKKKHTDYDQEILFHVHTTRKIACVARERSARCGVLFTPPVAYKGIAIACERNSLKKSLVLSATRKKINYSCHACLPFLRRPPGSRGRRLRPVIPSPTFPLLFQSFTFFDWSLPESKMFRDMRIWILHLRFQNETVCSLLVGNLSSSSLFQVSALDH